MESIFHALLTMQGLFQFLPVLCMIKTQEIRSHHVQRQLSSIGRIFNF